MEFLCNIPRQRCCGQSRWSADAESLEQSQGKTGGYPKCGGVYGRSQRWRNHLQFFLQSIQERCHMFVAWNTVSIWCIHLGQATGGLMVKKMKSTTTKVTLWRPLLHQYLLDPGEHLVSTFKHDKLVFV